MRAIQERHEHTHSILTSPVPFLRDYRPKKEKKKKRLTEQNTKTHTGSQEKGRMLMNVFVVDKRMVNQFLFSWVTK